MGFPIIKLHVSIWYQLVLSFNKRGSTMTNKEEKQKYLLVLQSIGVK